MPTSSFQLRPFQKRVLELVMRGRSVILQAPTGSGKTKAALIPFLQNMAVQGKKLPLTCRYAVPQRVLANQFYREYHTLAADIDRAAFTRLVETYQAIGRSAISIQTGEQPDDPQLEALLTFCTIDQLLASFLAVPYGLGPNRANLGVGGVAGSYLILDEFHLYPLLRDGKSVMGARTTTMQMLRLLKGMSPFVLMTATFSSTLLERLKVLLDAEVVTVKEQEELLAIAGGRTRTFQRVPDSMNTQAILAEHQQREQNKCTLIVCNSVWRAQKLFLEMKQQAEAQGTRVILLHSRFSVEDRKTLAEEVEQELGPKQWDSAGVYHGKDIIVIATQVVEVGLDISVQVLHTENAPANSLIQRAGRCARFAFQQGSVFVYPLPLDEMTGKSASPLPYDQELCDATWQALAQVDGQEVGFLEEQQLIDAVHTDEDLDLLERFQLNEHEIRELIFKSFNTNDRGVSSTLIRDVSQVHILIHDDPESAIKETPWRWQSFGMHADSFTNEKRWDALQARGADLEWVCQEAIPIFEETLEPDGADGVDNRRKTLYTWKPIANRAAAAQAIMIALPRHLALYDHELGFVLLDGRLDVEPNDYQSTLLPKVFSDRGNMGSHLTSYQDHIRGLVFAYNSSIRQDIRFAAQYLEEEMGLPSGMVDQAVRLAIACHDLGKLDQVWQQWAFAWQCLLFAKQKRPLYQLPHPAFCFAKTDHQYSREQREWQREVAPNRPRHACESVVLGRKLIGASLGITKTAGKEYVPVLRAICGAIARHHSSQASAYAPATLNEHALKAAGEALQLAHQGLTWQYDPALLEHHIPDGGDLAPETASSPKLTRPELDRGRIGELETWLYFVIVRALRLADQRAG